MKSIQMFVGYSLHKFIPEVAVVLYAVPVELLCPGLCVRTPWMELYTVRVLSSFAILSPHSIAAEPYVTLC